MKTEAYDAALGDLRRSIDDARSWLGSSAAGAAPEEFSSALDRMEASLKLPSTELRLHLAPILSGFDDRPETSGEVLAEPDARRVVLETQGALRRLVDAAAKMEGAEQGDGPDDEEPPVPAETPPCETESARMAEARADDGADSVDDGSPASEPPATAPDETVAREIEPASVGETGVDDGSPASEPPATAPDETVAREIEPASVGETGVDDVNPSPGPTATASDETVTSKTGVDDSERSSAQPATVAAERHEPDGPADSVPQTSTVEEALPDVGRVAPRPPARESVLGRIAAAWKTFGRPRPTPPADAARLANVPSATALLIDCPTCSVRYRVQPKAIGVLGRTVQCVRCDHRWFVRPAR